MEPSRSAAADPWELALERWRPVPPGRVAGASPGERAGARLGGGIEFHDRRGYTAGDDLRRMDWSALARSDQMLVRLSREEVAPRLELLLDLSKSMEVEPAKAQLTRDLACFLARLARGVGWPLLVVGLGTQPRRIDGSVLLERARGGDLDRELSFEPAPPAASLVPAARSLLRPGALRLVLSDFLGGDFEPALAPLADGAGAVGLVQVLGSEEAEPKAGGRARLVDAETGAFAEVELDRTAVERYLARLEGLRGALALGARRVGGSFASLVAAPAEQPEVHLALLHRAGFIEPG